MKIKTAILFSIDTLAYGYGWADTGGAPPLQVSKTLSINASVDKVWSTVKDFNALNSWHPAVEKDEIVEGKNNTVGAVRLLTLKGGGTIKEKLLAYDPAGHSFAYSIVEGVIPVSSYKSNFSVKSTGDNQSSVTWSGHFKRKNVGDNPADNENDKAAKDAITGVYQSGLDNLKKMLEAK